MENKIVVHMKGGEIHKGVIHDFHEALKEFHLLPAEGGGVPLRIRSDDMKAMFFVKDYLGNRDFVARKQFDEAKREARQAVLTFEDGEEMWGTLGEGVDGDGQGFYFFPVDPEDNNVRVFVIRSSLKEMREVT